MADGTGLSVGASRLTAVVVDRTAVSRAPVLTLYPHRPPEVGVPSENPNLSEPGLIVTDFVDRVGDPIPIVAADGTAHRAEALLAEALQAMVRTVAAGGPVGPIAVSHPAHWSPAAVAALRAVLAGADEFAHSGGPLLSDAEAALIALARDPGLPTRGVVAVCDFGGTGTSLTLFDLAAGTSAPAPLAPTVRHADLSGALIDQALMKHVIDGMSEAGTLDLSGTSAIDSLGRQRAQCRVAKEQLSTGAVASITVDAPGGRTDVRITRDELDALLHPPLREFAEVMQTTLERNGIRPGGVAAIASIGGGARMPAATTALSERFRVPIVTTAHPELTAAIGAGLHAVRATAQEGMTSAAPAALPIAGAAESPPAEASSGTFRALAWSDADDIPDYVPEYGAPAELAEYGDPSEVPEIDGPRPSLQFTQDGDTGDTEDTHRTPWYRRPAVLAAIAAAVLAAVAVAAALLSREDGTSTPTTPSPTTTTTAPSPGSPLPAPPPQPATEAPASRTQ
ncbi:Hsp70 family protein, partial [Mycolicibacterium pyrenivorans]|uniref:Hsp70 family protein n=1 Tax=Mycolicibacterium pyrenivorans TaxID=187102 RepID=UPI0021F30E84